MDSWVLWSIYGMLKCSAYSKCHWEQEEFYMQKAVLNVTLCAHDQWKQWQITDDIDGIIT